LWSAPGMTTYVVPTPVIAHDLAIVTSAGPGGSALMALHEDGSIAWRNDRAAAYVASPVVSGELLFTVKDNGVMSCLNARSGVLYWQKRLPARGTYFASPVAVEGRIYVSSEDGTTVVIAAKREFEVLAVNALEGPMWASPAVGAGFLCMRTGRALWSIRNSNRASAQ
jgi:outer membrane protein assembly factor BamB